MKILRCERERVVKWKEECLGKGDNEVLYVFVVS